MSDPGVFSSSEYWRKQMSRGMILAGALLGASIIAPRPKCTRWSFFLVGIGLYLLAVLQVWPPDDGQKSLELHKEAMARAITNGVFPWAAGATKTVVAGLLLGLMVASILRHRVAAVFYFAVVVGFTILFELIHEGALRHHGFLLFAFVAATWIAVVENDVAARDAEVRADRPSLRTLFAVLVLVFFPWVVDEQNALRSEVSERFSNGPAMGRFLHDNGYENRAFVLSLSAVVSVPWIVGDVYYPAGALKTKYLAWNALQFQNRGMGPKGVLDGSKEFRQSHPDAMVLLTSKLEDPSAYGLRLIHQESAGLWYKNGERLYLYGAGEPAAGMDGVSGD